MNTNLPRRGRPQSKMKRRAGFITGKIFHQQEQKNKNQSVVKQPAIIHFRSNTTSLRHLLVHNSSFGHSLSSIQPSYKHWLLFSLPHRGNTSVVKGGLWDGHGSKHLTVKMNPEVIILTIPKCELFICFQCPLGRKISYLSMTGRRRKVSKGLMLILKNA